MDKWQAQAAFWEKFGAAYEENSVPDNAGFPRITYNAAVNDIDNIVSVQASVWTRSTSWASADAITSAIEREIKSMGCPIIEGGRYRVFIGNTPFAQKMGDPNDDLIKRVLISVNFEFLTF